MPKLRLSYFDFDGGRGEPIRLAFHLGNIDFEDHRFPISDWPLVRDQTPLRQAPTLEIDGKIMTQSNSILRYAGKLSSLYPTDPLDALHCDEVLDAIEDISSQLAVTYFMEDEEEKRQTRLTLADGPISLYLTVIGAMLESRGGQYFAGNQISVADLKALVWIRKLRSGLLDHIPIDLVDSKAPILAAHQERISSHFGIASYYASRA